MNIKKAKTIVKAFLSELPTGEKWYEDRLEICNSCEYNTKNIERNKLSMTDRIKISTGVCDNKNHCTACGCCIERKSSVKGETCGLTYLNMEPKWVAIEVESTLNDGISIINMNPELGTLTYGDSGFVYDFGSSSDNVLTTKFQIKNDKGKLDVKSYNAGCSCTLGEMLVIDENTVEFKVDISTVNFRKEDLNMRSMNVVYNVENKNFTKTINITFKVFKNG
jgi:hypothetical protein